MSRKAARARLPKVHEPKDAKENPRPWKQLRDPGKIFALRQETHTGKSPYTLTEAGLD